MAGAGVKVGIVGASGYTGAELLRLAAQHPDLDVVVATGDRGVTALLGLPDMRRLICQTCDA